MLPTPRFAENPLCRFETNVAGHESLLASDLMISDWSGAALEYAFGLEKPVLFLDMPRKVNNPEWEQVGIDPLEITIRESLGAIVSPDALDDMPDTIRRLVTDPGAFAERIRKLRDETLFHVGSSGRVGAREILARCDAVFVEVEDEDTAAH